MRFLITILISALIIGASGGGIYYFVQKSTQGTIRIAVIGLDNESDGVVNAVKLYAKQLNQAGGIQGRRILVDVFDDQNNPKKAKEIARAIHEQGEILAVIGHGCNLCSIQAGNVYQDLGIPAITPTSRGIGIVEDNPWFFRNIFENSSQAKFLAHYVENVFQPKATVIIHDKREEETLLAEIYSEQALNLNLEVPQRWGYSHDDPDLDNKLEAIVDELVKKVSDSSPIFLVARIPEGVKIIRLLKDKGVENLILSTDRFSSLKMRQHFQKFSKEKLHPGYYMDGIYVVTPLIYELANVRAQQFSVDYFNAYQQEAGWREAYAYDTAKVILEAIKNTDIGIGTNQLKQNRKKIQEYLKASTNVTDAVEGTTGFNYFNEQGTSQKPVTIGIHKGLHFLPALYQFQTIQDIKEINTLEEDLDEKRIMQMDEIYLHKTSVIHTGIDIKEIKQLDVNNLIFKMDFELWFRYHQGELDIGDIEFLNAAKPIQLRSPIVEEILNQTVYRRYKVTGLFNMDFLPNNEFGQHILGVTFRHKKLTRGELIYVKDVLGMSELKKDNIQENNRILSPIYGWTIADIQFFQNISKKKTKGSLKYINHKEKTVEHSRFTARVAIRSSEFSLRRSIPSVYVNLFFGLNLLLILLLILIGRTSRLQYMIQRMLPFKQRMIHEKEAGFSYFDPDEVDTTAEENLTIKQHQGRVLQKVLNVRMVFYIVLYFSLLLIAESFLMSTFLEKLSNYYLDVIILIFDLFWWFLPARIIVIAVNRYIFDVLETRTEQGVSKLVRNALSFVVYLFTIIGVVAFVFDFKITSLLATSGVLMMIIGLAIQLNIANIFSGLAINMEHPYRLGDWVEIGDYPEGRVKDINWRTTRLEKRNGCILCIPNSIAAESVIHNFSLPNELFYWRNKVHLDVAYDPKYIKKLLLDAVMAVETNILKDPAPSVAYSEVTEDNAVYMVLWAAKDAQGKYAARQEVWLSIYAHLKRAGIKWGKRTQDIYMHQETEDQEPKPQEITPLKSLQEVEVFDCFSEQDLNYLSQKVKIKPYKAEQKIIKQGDRGDSLFVIMEGIVGVNINLEDGQQLEVARMGAGKFFGEMALLTGEPRTADIVAINDSILLEITKSDITPMMRAQPELSRHLSEILTQRKLNTESQKNGLSSEHSKETLVEQFLTKIQGFFRL